MAIIGLVADSSVSIIVCKTRVLRWWTRGPPYGPLLNEQRFNKEAIERQLAHIEPGVGGIYNHAEYLAERRIMMQAWADYLDALKTM